MGTNLIIKGADFSQDGVDLVTYTWYTDTIESAQEGQKQTYGQSSESYSSFVPNHSYTAGQIVNCLRMGCATAGTITVARCTLSGSTVGSGFTLNDTRVLNITKTGDDFIVKFEPITMGEGDYIAVRINGDSCQFYNYSLLQDAMGYWIINTSTSKITTTPVLTTNIGFDFGKYE
jgi:hypothetical protein